MLKIDPSQTISATNELVTLPARSRPPEFRQVPISRRRRYFDVSFFKTEGLYLVLYFAFLVYNVYYM